jgi:hypothetical protein
MKPRTTIVLLLLAAALGGYVYWDFKHGTTTEEAERKAKQLLTIKSADATRLELVASNQTIVVEKINQHWSIKQPLSVRADDSAVNAIIDQLEFAQRDRTFTEKEITASSLADFGITNPRLRLTVRDKQGDHVVLFGNATPTKEAVYIQVQGEKMPCLTGKSLFERANVTLDSLRDRTVLEAQGIATTRIELKTADRVIELARNPSKNEPEPRWAFVKPFQARADQQKVGDLLAVISALRVQDFVSEDPKDAHTHQLDDPRHEVTLWTGDKGQTLLIGRIPTNDTAKVFAKLKSADSIFTLPADSVKKFDLQVNDLRDTHVLTVADTNVQTIAIARGADKITLSRSNRFWNVVGATLAPADDARVQDILRRLTELTTTQFVADVATDLGKYGLTTPMLAVTLQDAGTNALAQLFVGGVDPTGKTRYVKRGDERFIYGVPAGGVDKITATRGDYRSRRIAEIKMDQVTKLTIEQHGTRTVAERGADKKWKLIEPAQAPLNNDRLQQILDAVVFLQAEDIVRENLDNAAACGLDKPMAKFTVATSTKTYALEIGAAKNTDVYYASWNDPALIFTLGSPVVGTITNNIVAPAVATTNIPTAKPAKP